MNITDLHIEDVRKRGIYADPVVELKVDEPVYEQATPIHVEAVLPGARAIPCGPFYAVEHQYGPDAWDEPKDLTLALGEWNKYGLIKDQLMPVRIVTPEEVLDLAMIVPRVKRLVRRHQGNTWQVQVDEEAAALGFLQWRVERSDPVCYGGAVPFADPCSRTPNQTIVYKGTHLSLCVQHIRAHQDRMRSARKS